MLLALVIILVNIELGLTALWPKGIVHFTINTKDYDAHSQDIITSTLSSLHQEICVKFFETPLKPAEDTRILYISNPDKRKDCDFNNLNFTDKVVDLVIGYKCLNTEDITTLIASMLKAGIEQTSKHVNSFDLLRKFENQDRQLNPTNRRTLLAPSDRNYINAHYHHECGSLTSFFVPKTRRAGDETEDAPMSQKNINYYRPYLWPMGIVMYKIEDRLRGSANYYALKYAMSTIEMSSCVVFQEMQANDVLDPRSMLFFGSQGADMAKLGFQQENQTLSLEKMVVGAPGHTAHTLLQLMRVLGVPMMSNRYDRDNYVTVNWERVDEGKLMYLAKDKEDAWIQGSRVLLPYDFDSVTHAPANFICSTCYSGAATITPIQDYLWQLTMTMGHTSILSAGDKEILRLLYDPLCAQRFTNDKR